MLQIFCSYKVTNIGNQLTRISPIGDPLSVNKMSRGLHDVVNNHCKSSDKQKVDESDDLAWNNEGHSIWGGGSHCNKTMITTIAFLWTGTALCYNMGFSIMGPFYQFYSTPMVLIIRSIILGSRKRSSTCCSWSCHWKRSSMHYHH